jgi:hypothetical protein
LESLKSSLFLVSFGSSSTLTPSFLPGT